MSYQVSENTSTTPKPEEHLRLIHRVIHQIGLKGDLAEEAYSESLVTIVEAARSYDPTKGPLANWLANNIRWSIHSWLSKQRLTIQITNSVEATRETIETKVQLKEIMAAMKKLLTETEYKVIVLTAVGYSGKEVGEKLGISPVQVTRNKQHAREKLDKFR